MPPFGRPAHAPRGAPRRRPAAPPAAEFVGSFPDPLVPLSPALPEIALVGRSNVGKSSLLNALVGRPGLARVSGTPGKTTLLNAYRLPGFYLIDLPGYGFARAGKGAREGYRKLVTRCLGDRPTLDGIVWLLDIRHDPSDDDLEMQQLLIRSGRPVLAALTKADKLSRTAAAERARHLGDALGLTPDQVQVTSARTGLGVAELAASIVAAVEEEQ